MHRIRNYGELFAPISLCERSFKSVTLPLDFSSIEYLSATAKKRRQIRVYLTYHFSIFSLFLPFVHPATSLSLYYRTLFIGETEQRKIATRRQSVIRSRLNTNDSSNHFLFVLFVWLDSTIKSVFFFGYSLLRALNYPRYIT